MTCHFFLVRRVFVLAVLLLFVPRASADPIPWDYTGTIVTTGPSDTSSIGGPVTNPLLLIGRDSGGTTYPGDQVQFANITGSASGSSSVTAFQVRANTDFGGGVFSSNIHTFTLGFGILDQASGASGTLTFQGNVSGSLKQVFIPPSLSGGEVNLQVAFTGATTQSLLLGNHLYTVSIGSFTFPRYGETLPNPLPFVTSYQNVPVTVLVTDVPEPSTLVLASAALAGLGWRAWRRRRARQLAV